MSDNSEATNEPRHLTPEEQTFKTLTEQFKLVQSSISSLSQHMTGTQQRIAQHFQQALMKELVIFRRLEKQVRDNTLTTELMQESLTALNILRVDSMAEVSAIMEDAMREIKEALMDKE